MAVLTPVSASTKVSFPHNRSTISSRLMRSPRRSSNATLKGDYGLHLTGTNANGTPPAPLQQVIGVGMVHFDGAGNFTQTDNIHGSITGFTAPDRPGRGTYSIQEDCTGVSTLLIEGQAPVERRLVVVDKGKELR